MLAVIQQKCNAHKYRNFKQIADDVVLLLKECKKSKDVNAMEVRHNQFLRFAFLLNTLFYRFHQLEKIIRRAWSSKDNYSSCNSSRDVPARTAREFHRRTIFSLALERKPLCRHSVVTRNSLTTFLELMLDLDASVSRHELLCHVLSYGWDYMARASNEGSLFVQPVSSYTSFLCSVCQH